MLSERLVIFENVIPKPGKVLIGLIIGSSTDGIGSGSNPRILVDIFKIIGNIGCEPGGVRDIKGKFNNDVALCIDNIIGGNIRRAIQLRQWIRYGLSIAVVYRIKPGYRIFQIRIR